MSLRRIISFWRYHECSKYMFRMVEEHTKTIKKNPDEKYFFILEKIDFQNFKISKFSKMKISIKKIWKSKFWKNRKFQNYFEIFDFPKFRFSRFFYHEFWFLKKCLKILKFWKSIFSKMKKYFSSGFFLLSWYVLPPS